MVVSLVSSERGRKLSGMAVTALAGLYTLLDCILEHLRGAIRVTSIAQKTRAKLQAVSGLGPECLDPVNSCSYQSVVQTLENLSPRI